MSAGPAPAAAIPAGGSGPAEVWESPEATLRYLAEQALGRGAAVTLWWDGGLGSWVPWVWTGPSPGPRPQEPADALHLRTECGEFRLSGAGERSDQLPVAALTRVAEDMALRDLLRWRREARGLAALGLPDLHGESAALAGWVAPVRRILAATAVLMWRREGPLWRLVHAEGEGLGLEGTFTLPGDLFTATFEGERSPWRRWEPTPGLRAHLRLEGEDPRWPLRLRRVERALTGEGAAW